MNAVEKYGPLVELAREFGITSKGDPREYAHRLARFLGTKYKSVSDLPKAYESAMERNGLALEYGRHYGIEPIREEFLDHYRVRVADWLREKGRIREAIEVETSRRLSDILRDLTIPVKYEKIR